MALRETSEAWREHRCAGLLRTRVVWVRCLSDQRVLFLDGRDVAFEQIADVLEQLVVCLELARKAVLNASELVD